MPQVEGPAIRYFLNDLPEGLRQALRDHLAHCIRGAAGNSMLSPRPGPFAGDSGTPTLEASLVSRPLTFCDNPLVADTKLPPWNSGSLLSCEAVGRDSIRYFLNDLPEGLRQAMRDHFAHCIRCRRKLDAFTTAWAAEGQRRKRTGDS
jgi:hypothetical protein